MDAVFSQKNSCIFLQKRLITDESLYGLDQKLLDTNSLVAAPGKPSERYNAKKTVMLAEIRISYNMLFLGVQV